MDVAPPPAPGLRMREVGDRLIVSFGPRRSGLVFLSIWLLGWTFFGVEAWSSVSKPDAGGAAFLLVWLCGWFLGECAVICIVAWKLFGRVSLAVTPDELDVRHELGRFSWTRRYETTLVEDIGIGRMPEGEDGLHKDYSLRMSYDGQTVWLGGGMGEREAEHVASVVWSRIRASSWWNYGDETRRRPAEDAGPRFEVSAPAFAKALLFPAVVIAALALIALPLVRRSHHHRPAHALDSTTRIPPRPARSDFSNARDYAEATTSWVLSSAGAVQVGRPHCDAHSTWTHWSCRALLRSDPATRVQGPPVPYRCRSSGVGGFTCSLALPPPAKATTSPSS